MSRVYYQEAVGALLVFDVTRASTFDAVLKWKEDLDSKVTTPQAGFGAPLLPPPRRLVFKRAARLSSGDPEPREARPNRSPGQQVGPGGVSSA